MMHAARTKRQLYSKHTMLEMHALTGEVCKGRKEKDTHKKNVKDYVQYAECQMPDA